ncbi:MAG: four helix bundle protein [Terriglobia bacterium]|jgi:four helix bundle protein
MNSKTETSGNAKGPIKQKPTEICERSVAYALRAIKLYRYLQVRKDGAGWILGGQYLRSACSIGANIEEAQAGESRSDFIHKLSIAQKEARESKYWLKLLSESGIVAKEKLKSLMEETQEPLAVITAIIVSTKGQHAPKKPVSQSRGGSHLSHGDSQALIS